MRIFGQDTQTPKAYVSFPITGLPDEELAEVEDFKKAVLRKYVGFDPHGISERSIVIASESLSDEISEVFHHLEEAISQLTRETEEEDLRWSPVYDNFSAFGLTELRVGNTSFPGRQVLSILKAIDSQIISRDFLLIDQSDFVLVYIRTGENGHPLISAGCQSEIVYAYSKGKSVFGVCRCDRRLLSPWVTRFSEVFETLPDAMEFLESRYGH